MEDEPVDESRQRLSVDETAAYLGVHLNTLKGWRRQNKGPLFLRFGRRVVYDTADLDRFLEAARRGEPEGVEYEAMDEPMDEPTQRLSAKEAAKYLGLKPSTLTLWRDRGEGPPYCAVYEKADLDRFIEATRREAMAARDAAIAARDELMAAREQQAEHRRALPRLAAEAQSPEGAEESENNRYSVEHAAAYLGISPYTLKGWRGKGKGPIWLKLGGRVLYDKADLDRFLESARRGGPGC